MDSRVPIERDAAKSQMEGLWNSWPGLIFLGLAWAIGSAIFLGRAHVKIVQEFAAGIATRTQSNLDRDITRLQHT